MTGVQTTRSVHALVREKQNSDPAERTLNSDTELIRELICPSTRARLPRRKIALEKENSKRLRPALTKGVLGPE